jgi:hypothetical protein
MNYLLEVWLANPFAIYIFWIFAFLGVVGISVELRMRLKIELPASLLISFFGILNILYWGAFLNFHITQLLVLSLGYYSLVKNYKIIESDKLRYLVLFTFALWFAGISNNTIPFSWDEFFWNLFDHHINQYSQFWTTESAILLSHIRYMPGPSLWHNFFGIKGHYNEATAYFANSIILLIFLYWFISHALKNNKLFLSLVIFIALGSFSEGWYSLYADHLLALMIAIALISSIKSFQGSNEHLLILILSLSGAILFKETGIVSGLALVAALLLAYIFKMKIRSDWKYLALGVVYIFSILFSWKFYQSAIGASNPVNLANFTDFSEEMITLRIGVILSFLKYIATEPVMIATWIVCFLILRSLVKIKDFKVTTAFFTFTVLGWIGIHLVAALFLLTPADALGLAGWTRYMGAFLLALFVFYSVHLSSVETFKLKQKIIFGVFLVWLPINLLLIGIKPSALFILATPHPKQVPIARKQINELQQNIPTNVIQICKENPQKIWYIYQNSNGLEAMKARGILFPCQVSHYSWSLGAPYYKDDVWTANLNDTDFLEMAASHPLMVLGNIDEQFINNYGHHFVSSPEVKMLYKFDPSLKKYSDVK